MSLCHPVISTLFPYSTLFRSYVYSVKLTLTVRIPSKPGAVYCHCFTAAIADCANASFVDCKTVTNDAFAQSRSEEHTSELQSHSDLVCRLLLEKKNSSS